MLTGRGLVVRRAGRTLLGGVDVEVRAGELVAVTGPSGSGKTTLLTVLAGLEPPDAGTVELDGVALGAGTEAGVRRGIAVVVQGHALVSLLTAAENVEVALQGQDLPRPEVRARAAEALGQVGLAGREDHLVEELSGGQRQRVALARALAVRPRVLLADEPTAELDAATRSAVLVLLTGLAAGGAAVVLATHDPVVAAEADRRLHVGEGRLDRVA